LQRIKALSAWTKQILLIIGTFKSEFRKIDSRAPIIIVNFANLFMPYKRLKNLLQFCVALILLTNQAGAQTDYTQYVNPFIGTGGHGHTYPGATLPFGMVQLSPDTRLTGWDGCSGYHYSDTLIYGFSHTHLSGTGVSDYGDVLISPTTGKLSNKQSDYTSGFSKKSETAQAGYYSVFLNRWKIQAELTATLRCGLHRYSFPENANANLVIDLEHRDEVLDAQIELVDEYTVRGHRFSRAWAENQKVFFYIRFSEPIAELLWNDSTIAKPFNAPMTVKGKKVRLALGFGKLAGKKLIVKTGLSFCNTEGAEANLKAEALNEDFDALREKAKLEWNKQLSKIEVFLGTPSQRSIFYTSLYHLFIVPNLITDVNGNYPGMDGKIHKADGFQQYTVFSLWDTFRAAHPLYTILEPTRTRDFIISFLNHYQQGGKLPVWELAANETNCMIGYHSVSVIADAYFKGIRNFDTRLALKAMKASAHSNEFGLDAYRKHGVISADDEHESVSKTLEYAYDDWCIAQFAKALGEEKDYREFSKRSLYYRNIFDPETKFMRPRQNGSFLSPFDPREVNNHFTEANSWQYSFFVPHDMPGFINLLGGRDLLEKKLDELFSADNRTTGRTQVDITGLVGQYAHGNEPSHHMAYLYNYTANPWKTQKTVRMLLDSMYKNTPDGIIGNEDCGQMSAWYVMSALGFYSVVPGLPVYSLGTPLFPVAKINLENGKIFNIRATGVSDKNYFVSSTWINGKRSFNLYLNHEDIMAGGELMFTMAGEPLKSFRYQAEHTQPEVPSVIKLITIPTINAASRVFTDSLQISLNSLDKNYKLYYTVDGTTPTEKSIAYQQPFFIKESINIKARSIHKSDTSHVVEARFYKKSHNYEIKIAHPYNSQYHAGGPDGLFDEIRGTVNWRKGDWQGYQSHDFMVDVDLKEAKKLHSIHGSFLQDSRSWILMPVWFSAEVSSDGKNYRKLFEVNHQVKPDDYNNQIIEMGQSFEPTEVRYLRLKAKNFGTLPEWHQGYGGDAFIFVDEILLNKTP
jgi:predicted alpha-1,2-mannosidase